VAAISDWIWSLWDDARDWAEGHTRARAEVQRLRDELALREWFISALAHDLRGPLSAAQLNGELMLSKLEDPALKRMMTRMMRGLRTSDRLIHDLLDVQRTRAGHQPALKRVSCDLRELAADLLDELEVSYGGRVRANLEGLDISVRGLYAGSELRRALWNLLHNALKCSDPDKPVTLEIARHGDELAISVHNQGAPIAPDELPFIFSPFQRAKSGEEHSAGWGIGLALVQACAERHGGSITVESDPDRGTTFTMRMPWVPAPRAARGLPPAAELLTAEAERR
jgi:signal transduction histidine kinase